MIPMPAAIAMASHPSHACAVIYQGGGQMRCCEAQAAKIQAHPRPAAAAGAAREKPLFAGLEAGAQAAKIRDGCFGNPLLKCLAVAGVLR